MEMTISFSVIMPAYNAQETIANSIMCILKQTYPYFELIIVDDGSSDKTREIIGSINDIRIKTIHIDNSGVSTARNIGIKNSSNEYICFLDSDDYWRENHLEILKELIEKFKSKKVFFTGFEISDMNNQVYSPTTKALGQMPDDVILTNNLIGLNHKFGQFFHINSLCILKSCITDLFLFNTQERIGEDTDFVYRLSCYHEVVICRKNTTVYNRNENSITGKKIYQLSWCFQDSAQILLGDSQIPYEVKESIKNVVESHKITFARNHLLLGQKKEARAILKTIDEDYVDKRYFFRTKLFSFIPHFFLEIGRKIRDRGYLA